MKRINIELCSLEDVLRFVDIASCLKGKVLICSGMYRVDAKSIVGILSLDLNQPLGLEIEEWNIYLYLIDIYIRKTKENLCANNK